MGLRTQVVLTLNPLAASRSAETKWGEGEDCLSAESTSSAAAHFVEQLREAVGLDVGCLFVWLLYFGQAKKSHSPKGERDCLKLTILPSP